MRHLFLVNIAACDGKAGPFWKSIEHRFREAFPQMEVHFPSSVAASKGITAEATVAGEPVCIVTVGGEGTMNSALNGIMRSGPHDHVSMALVPFGNVNDYGANIGLEKTWQHALATLVSGRQARVGVTRMTADDVTEYALNIADIGFGATTAKSHSVDRQLSWLKGQFKYNILALKTLLKWKNVPARITVDDQVIRGEIAILLAGFSPTLGGFHLVPHASPTSDDFAVTVGLNASKPKILGLIQSAKGRNLEENELIHFYRAKRVLVEAEEPMVAEVDGEIVSTGSTRILFEALPKEINFIVPPDSPLKTGAGRH